MTASIGKSATAHQHYRGTFGDCYIVRDIIATSVAIWQLRSNRHRQLRRPLLPVDKLGAVIIGKNALAPQQFAERALFDDAAIAQDDDAVAAAHRRQTMGNDKGGAAVD